MYTIADYVEVLPIYGKPEGMQERLAGCINNVSQKSITQLPLCFQDWRRSRETGSLSSNKHPVAVRGGAVQQTLKKRYSSILESSLVLVPEALHTPWV
jgi:hypothetical protein